MFSLSLITEDDPALFNSTIFAPSNLDIKSQSTKILLSALAYFALNY